MAFGMGLGLGMGRDGFGMLNSDTFSICLVLHYMIGHIESIKSRVVDWN